MIAGYFIGELASDQLLNTAEALWSRTNDTLVIVEPGTSPGFARIRHVRSYLIEQGGHVICPCPHDDECPLTRDDWCHFSQRLNRSRDHRQVKGTALPFEDEKFSYVALARRKPALTAKDRVLAPPHVTKIQIATKLCTACGVIADVEVAEQMIKRFIDKALGRNYVRFCFCKRDETLDAAIERLKGLRVVV